MNSTVVYYSDNEFEEIYNDRVCMASIANHQQKATENAYLCHLRSLRLQLICSSYRKQRKHNSAPELPGSPSGSGKLQRNVSLFNLSGHALSIRPKKNDKGSQRMRIVLDSVNAVCHHIERTAQDPSAVHVPVSRTKKEEDREIENILNKLLNESR